MVKLAKSSRELWDEHEAYEAMQKGGEGSRGGHVIGHTKSGKPIYEQQIEHHLTEAARHAGTAAKHEYGDKEDSRDKWSHHQTISDVHYEHAMSIASKHKLSSDKIDELREHGFEASHKKGHAKDWSEFTPHKSEK